MFVLVSCTRLSCLLIGFSCHGELKSLLVYVFQRTFLTDNGNRWTVVCVERNHSGHKGIDCLSSLICHIEYIVFIWLWVVPIIFYCFFFAILSIGRDTKSAVFYVQLRISQPGLYRSAWKFAWWFRLISDRFSPIVGDSPRDGRILGVNRGNMVGYASRWSTCFVLFAQLVDCLLYTSPSPRD